MHLRGVVSVAAWLAVVGLGTDGGEMLADGDRLARGVHLRWGLRPDLGFPVGGYDVWRRGHRDAEWVCLRPDVGLLPPPGGVTEWQALGYGFELDAGAVHFDGHACAPTGAVHLPGQRSLEVRAPQPMVAVRATGTGTAPQLEVFATSGDGRRLAAATRGSIRMVAGSRPSGQTARPAAGSRGQTCGSAQSASVSRSPRAAGGG